MIETHAGYLGLLGRMINSRVARGLLLSMGQNKSYKIIAEKSLLSAVFISNGCCCMLDRLVIVIGAKIYIRLNMTKVEWHRTFQAIYSRGSCWFWQKMIEFQTAGDNLSDQLISRETRNHRGSGRVPG